MYVCTGSVGFSGVKYPFPNQRRDRGDAEARRVINSQSGETFLHMGFIRGWLFIDDLNGLSFGHTLVIMCHFSFQFIIRWWQVRTALTWICLFNYSLRSLTA